MQKHSKRAIRLARTRRRVYRTCGEWQFDQAPGLLLHHLCVLSVVMDVLEAA